jgi:hypothetical protein
MSRITFVQRHRPLITPNIEFRPECLPSHPSTTTHQEFVPDPFDSFSLDLDNFETLYRMPSEDDAASDTCDTAGDTPMELDDDGKSTTSDSEDEEEDRDMIEKPKGEVSRQYKLAEVLQQSGWAPERIDKLRVSFYIEETNGVMLTSYKQNYVHRRADLHLDTSVSYTSQKKHLVKLVCAEVIEHGEDLVRNTDQF